MQEQATLKYFAFITTKIDNRNQLMWGNIFCLPAILSAEAKNQGKPKGHKNTLMFLLACPSFTVLKQHSTQ